MSALMPTNPPLVDFRGQRVTVMGLGRFGGGVAAVRFLAERGARVTVTDLLREEDLADSLTQLDGLPLEAVHLGKHHELDFLRPDLIVANPAVPPASRYLELARAAGVPVTTEISLFWLHNRGRVIGVTGSNGKSTTAALTHAMLAASGKTCWLGGNIGRSLLPVVDDIGPDDWVVLELSSFQLHHLDALFTSPDVAVVTNFVPNHLDWHGCLAEYRRAKQTILRWQHAHHTAVLNADDPQLAGWKTNGRRVLFGRKVCNDTPCRDRATGSLAGHFGADGGIRVRWDGKTCELPPPNGRFPGRHNLQNVLAAACAALAAGAEPAGLERGMQECTPLPHRLEFLAEVAGRRFYNDSKATTPAAALAALEAFEQPVVLLAGGYDKHVNLRPLAAGIARHTKAVALMGQTAEQLAMLIGEEAFAGGPARQECDSFDAAFRWAVEHSQPGDVVLLSPGCASYDWFANYETRGERFRELVRAWGSSR